MNRVKKILVRTDGNEQIGFGHLFRSIAVAKCLQQHTIVTFIIDQTTPDEHIPSDFDVKRITDKTDETNWINSNFSAQEHLFIIDGYNFDFDYQSKLQSTGFNIVFIDDFPQSGQVADIVINPSLGVNPKEYKLESDQLGLGPSYAPLRPSFLTYARNHLQVSEIKTESVFVNFGGADLNNISNKVISILLKFDSIKEIKVVTAELDKIQDHPKVKAFTQLNEYELCEVIQSTDVAITSASTISYEVCSLRKPLLIGWYVENQKRLYSGLVENRLAERMGNVSDWDEVKIESCIAKFLSGTKKEIQKNQIKTFDGKNNYRIISLIAPLITKVRLRRAQIADLDTVFKWANDPDVRSQSLNPEKIKYEDHQAWFKQKIKAQLTFYYIATCNNEPIGQVRFDFREGAYLISYLVDKEHRGNGYGLQIVGLGICELSKEIDQINLIAEVKSTNKASKRVFERLQFSMKSDTKNAEVHIFVKK